MLTGNNENLWGYEDWGWKERLDGRTWGALYYYELLRPSSPSWHPRALHPR